MSIFDDFGNNFNNDDLEINDQSNESDYTSNMQRLGPLWRNHQLLSRVLL